MTNNTEEEYDDSYRSIEIHQVYLQRLEEICKKYNNLPMVDLIDAIFRAALKSDQFIEGAIIDDFHTIRHILHHYHEMREYIEKFEANKRNGKASD